MAPAQPTFRSKSIMEVEVFEGDEGDDDYLDDSYFEACEEDEYKDDSFDEVQDGLEIQSDKEAKIDV